MSEEISIELSEQQQMDNLQSNEKKQRSVKLCCSKPCSRNSAGRSPYVRQGLEIVLLSVVIVIVVLLLLLPTILYHLPLPSRDAAAGLNQSNMSGVPNLGRCSEQVAETDSSCSSNVTYSHTTCQDSLQTLQACLPGRQHSSDVHISATNQEEMEMQASQILNGLSALNPSPECQAVVQPFLCLYLFGLCSSSGVTYQPSFEECVYISTEICASEWTRANSFLTLLGMPPLPECTSFPRAVSATRESGSGGQDIQLPPMGRLSVQINCSTLQCQEGFSCSAVGNTSLCLPVCGRWAQYPHGTVVAIDVAIILSAAIGLVASIAVLIISCIRWKHMCKLPETIEIYRRMCKGRLLPGIKPKFTFPSVFVVYMAITVTAIAVCLLISYTDRTSLYCDSEHLLVIDSGPSKLVGPTAFCTLSGITCFYGVFQLAVWWFCHVVSLFWGIQFPFHARSFKEANHVKYIHIPMVIVGLVLPTLPVIVIFTAGEPSMRGFRMITFPPILCGSLQRDLTFYSLVLPLNLFLVSGIPLLIMILWAIYKHHGFFRTKLSKHPFKIGTAERKILIIFCYYVLLTVLVLTTFTVRLRNVEILADTIRDYWQCEATGVDPENSCNRLKASIGQLANPGLTTFSFVLLGIFPAVNLIFAVNISELKQKLKTWCG